MARVHFVTRLPVSFEAAREVAEEVLTEMSDTGVALDAEMFGFSVGRECILAVEQMAAVNEPIEVVVIPLRIADAEHPAAFPCFVGECEMVATDDSDVELALEGDYHPPAGPAGAALDAVALHTVAERALRGFFDEIASRLGQSARARDALRGVPV